MSYQVKRFYIMPAVWRTVTESQVFNWIKIFNENKVYTDLVSLTSKNRVQNSDEVLKIEKIIKGKFHQYKLLPLIVNDIVLFARLMKLYLNSKNQFDKIIFQSRVPSIGFALYLLKIFTNSMIVFESRGATIEERKYVNNANSIKTKLRNHYLYFSEYLLITKSHKLVVVSNALKNYYVRNFKINKRKFQVVPGVADSEIFMFKEAKKIEYRKKLGYKVEDMVVVYSGALGMKWEIPDEVFKFFSKMKKLNENYKFLILTPDVELANEYAMCYQLADVTTILEVPFLKVNDYLNASDFAILLREDVLMNNVASPTKFAEYLMAGLPVIISSGVLDFSKIIESNSFGIVISDYNELSNQKNIAIMNLKNINRNDISEWGIANLSKEVVIENYINGLINE